MQKGHAHSHGRRMVSIVLAGLLVAACGGGGSSSKKLSAPTQPHDVQDESTTTLVAGANAVDSPTSPSMSMPGGSRTTSGATTNSGSTKKGQASSGSKSTPTTARPIAPPGSIAIATPNTSPAKVGGVMTILNSSDAPANLDPATWSNLYSVAGGTLGTKATAIFDTLVYETSDGALHYRLATSLDPQGDYSNWVMKIRPNIRFTDGTPYDAQAIKFNWDRIKDPATKSPSQGFAAVISSLTVQDPTSLKIRLTNPNAQFPRSVALGLSAIQSPTAVQAGGADFGSGNAFPVGAGPFVIKSRVAGSELVLVRNASYWDSPKPYLDGLVFKGIADDSQRSNTFQSGGAQLSLSLGFPSVQQEDKAGFKHVLAETGGGRPILLNNSKPPFNDKLARQAIAAALDQQAYTNTVQLGYGKPLDSLFSSSSPFYNSSPKWPAADPKKAQALLDQYAAKTGGPLTFALTASATLSTDAEFVQAQLNQFNNIKVNLNKVAVTQITALTVARDYDALIYNLVWVDPEPSLSQQLLSTSSRNFTGYNNPDMDKALIAGGQSTNDTERFQAYATVAQLFNQDAPFVWMARTLNYLAVNKGITGLDLLEDGAPLPWDLAYANG